MTQYLLAIDQGTTSTRAIVFDAAGTAAAMAQAELTQHFPAPAWVEHDPEEIWRDALEVCREALTGAGIGAGEIAAVGITNQRETTVIWERDTGRPIHRAIVWQDRRTAEACRDLREAGAEPLVTERTGLLLDPYFSATKIAWILDHVKGARARAERGELAFGTIDTYLVWRLTGGASHATDATNASRTALFDIRVPRALLPEVRDCSADFGVARPELLGAPIPILGIAGDQQAALVGQAGLEPGMMKATFGTGCFMILNTGGQVVRSRHRLLSTVASRLDGRVTYGLEGSIFVAGAAVQWLRDGLELIGRAQDSEPLAARAGTGHGVYLVPAFTGLGAPYWDPAARGAILGLTRDTGIAEIVAAGLQAAAYQTRDLVEAMVRDGAEMPSALRVDGGMVANDWFAQFLADLLGTPVERPASTETTAWGAAFLAGLGAGLFDGPGRAADLWRLDRRFEPAMDTGLRDRLYAGWLGAVARVRSRPASLRPEPRLE
jgi:glycerol kinase